MNLDTFAHSNFAIVPFGGETTSDNPPDNQGNPTNTDPPANQGTEQGNSGQAQDPAAGGEPPADDDSDQYEGLSNKELRRILRDSESGKTKAEKERDAAKSKLDEQERAKLTKEQALEKDLADEREARKNDRALIERLAIIGAIRDESKYTWHDPNIVYDQLNKEIVKVNEKGDVEGITKELARIAKDHPYLMKTKEGQQGQGPTGFQPGQGGANSGGNQPPVATELVQKYPALASRMPSS
jgi:hypothetical protein